ncbi:hypothetical protein BLNAU_20916 [Blattamonas nauphoetae]|uniref:Uncharacterized protein n=1 Tax=Blattamonas nauphoetae TaxID=2049346 RepID=A0ABQ9WYG4_9EUKA|nr:hypothetical protein BLNAU_20916 [Blattamonas nauphoetae]
MSSFVQFKEAAVVRMRLSSLLIHKPSRCFISVRISRQNDNPVEMTTELSPHTTSEPIFRWNSFDFLYSPSQSQLRHKLRLSVANVEPINNISTHSLSTTTQNTPTPSEPHPDLQIISCSSTTFPLDTLFSILGSAPNIPVFAPLSADFVYAAQTLPNSLKFWLKGGVKGIQLCHKELFLASKLSHAYSAQNPRLVYALLNDPLMTDRTRDIVKKMSYHSGISSIVPSKGFPRPSSGSHNSTKTMSNSQTWMTFGDIFSDQQISGVFLLDFTQHSIFPSHLALPREIPHLPHQNDSRAQVMPVYCPIKVHICLLWAEANGDIRNALASEEAEKPDSLDAISGFFRPKTSKNAREMEDTPEKQADAENVGHSPNTVLPHHLRVQIRATDAKGEYFESREGHFEAAENAFRKGHVRLFQERVFFYQSTTLVSDRRAPLVISLVSREESEGSGTNDEDDETNFEDVDFPLITAAFSLKQSSSVLDYGVRFIRLVDQFLGYSLFFTVSISPLNRILRQFTSPMLEITSRISTPLLTKESSLYPPLLITRVTSTPLDLWSREHSISTRNFPDLPELPYGYSEKSFPFICVPVKHTFDANPNSRPFSQYLANMRKVRSGIEQAGSVDFSSFWTNILESKFKPNLSECVLPMYLHGKEATPPTNPLTNFTDIIPKEDVHIPDAVFIPPTKKHYVRPLLPLPPPDLLESHYSLQLPPAEKSVAGVDVITNDMWASMDFHTYVDAKDALSKDLTFVAQFFAPLIRQETKNDLLKQGLISILEMEGEKEEKKGEEEEGKRETSRGESLRKDAEAEVEPEPKTGSQTKRSSKEENEKDESADRMNMFQRLFTVVNVYTPTFIICKAIAFVSLNNQKNPLVRDSISALRLHKSFVVNDATTLCPLDINTYTPVQIACQLSPIKGQLERKEDKEKGVFVLEDEIEDEFGEVQLVTDYTDVMDEADLTPYVVVRVDEKKKKKKGDEEEELSESESRNATREIVSFALLDLDEEEREAAVLTIKKKAEKEAEAAEEQDEDELLQLMEAEPRADVKTGRERQFGIDTRFVMNAVTDDEEDDEDENEIAQEMLNNIAETMKQKAEDDGVVEEGGDEEMASEFDMETYLDMTRFVLEKSNEEIQVNLEEHRLAMAGLVVSSSEREVIRRKVKEKEESRKEEEERRRQAERMNPIRRNEMEEKKELEKRKEEEEKQKEEEQKELELGRAAEARQAKAKTRAKSKPKPKQIANWRVEDISESDLGRRTGKGKNTKNTKSEKENDEEEEVIENVGKPRIRKTFNFASSKMNPTRSMSDEKMAQVMARLQEKNSFLAQKLGYGLGSNESSRRSSTTSLNDLDSGSHSPAIVGDSSTDTEQRKRTMVNQRPTHVASSYQLDDECNTPPNDDETADLQFIAGVSRDSGNNTTAVLKSETEQTRIDD